jgi:mannan endo-1,4-beta-mannosidase
MNESTSDANWHSCVEQCIANKIIPEVEIHDVTCGTDANGLNNVAKWWVTKASYLTQASIAKYILINIANEWGDWAMSKNNPSAWSAAYKTAVATMRAGGINTTLVIDAPDCGQDITNGSTLKSYALSVLNSDSKKNCLFTVHLYGEWCSGGGSTPTTGLPAIKNAGIPFIVGEFAAQSSAGTLNAASVISTCETNRIGWMAWSWKGNNEPVIDMSSDWAGTNLTSWGKTAVTGTYGTKTATTCSVFLTNTDTRFPEKASAIEPEIQVSLHSLLKGVIKVDLRGLSGATAVKIMDISGKLVQEEIAVDRQSFQLSSNVRPGVYLVKIINAQRTFDRKIFIR